MYVIPLPLSPRKPSPEEVDDAYTSETRCLNSLSSNCVDDEGREEIEEGS